VVSRKPVFAFPAPAGLDAISRVRVQPLLLKFRLLLQRACRAGRAGYRRTPGLLSSALPTKGISAALLLYHAACSSLGHRTRTVVQGFLRAAAERRFAVLMTLPACSVYATDCTAFGIGCWRWLPGGRGVALVPAFRQMALLLRAPA